MVSRLRVSLELTELQSFSAASTPTGSGTNSAPCERILKPHCREGAGAAARASHHTRCAQAVFSQHTHDFPGKLFRGDAVLHCSENTATAATGVGLGKSVAAAEPPREAPEGRTAGAPVGSES